MGESHAKILTRWRKGVTELSKLLRSFLKDWTGKLGLLCGVVGIIIAIYAYNPVPQRVPNLVVDPVRTTIINSKMFPGSSLKVIRGDNVVVKDDVTALRFYFWNSGKQSIKPDNILQSLSMSLNDANAEILDYKVLKVSRPDVIKIRLTPSDNNPSRELLLTFNILEENDGFTCQIIYAGNPSAELETSGVIEGVRRINGNETVSGGRFWSELLRLLPIYLVVVVGIAVFIYLAFRGVVWLLFTKKEKGQAEGRTDIAETAGEQKPKPRKYYVVRAVSLLLAVGLILYVVYALFIHLPEESARSRVLESVPSTIKP
jgi:hypothetical protein